MEDLEELVETALQEVVQPLDHLGPYSPHCSPFLTPVQSPPQYPLRIMANVNANPPPPQPTWREISFKSYPSVACYASEFLQGITQI